MNYKLHKLHEHAMQTVVGANRPEGAAIHSPGQSLEEAAPWVDDPPTPLRPVRANVLSFYKSRI